MKYLFSAAFAVLVSLAGTMVYGQKVVKEGTLIYDITVKSVNPADKIPAGFENGRLTIYFNPSQSRKEFVTGMGAETSVFDNNARKGFILKEYSGQKLMITLDGSDWQALNEKTFTADFTDSGSETIAGLRSNRATGQIDGRNITVFYAPEVQLANTSYSLAFPQLNGLPTRFELQSGNLTFTYTLASYNEALVSNAKFDAPVSGYRVMSFKESQQLKRAGN